MPGLSPVKLVSIACLALAGTTARADLYAASAAIEAKDFARAFELFREIAELGRLEGQESLAISYVNGEGVKRDNVLGLGWALIARENGGGAEMQRLIDQLSPHMNEPARRRIAELQAQFGKEALQKRLVPELLHADLPTPSTSCTFDRIFTPREAGRRDLSGQVFVNFVVMPDGRARNPRVLYAAPAQALDERARESVLRSTYKPRIENGVPVRCSLSARITYRGADAERGKGAFEKSIVSLKAAAESRDPRAELSYGLALADPKRESRGEYIFWLVKSAQAGLPVAQFLSGLYLSTFTAVPGNVEKGRAWLAIAADAGQPEAQVAIASDMLQSTTDAKSLDEARNLLERSVESGSANGRYYLAALLATTPDVPWRDPQRALDLLSDILADVDIDPTALEIRAAAQAQLGNFEAAVKDQKRALDKARSLGWDPAQLQLRLDKYQAREAWSGNLFAF